jgi:membrane-associated protease RseP (regulator of RpoE activity)
MTNGADEANPTRDQPMEPTEPTESAEPAEVAPADPPPPPDAAAPSRGNGGWLLPKWVIAALVGLVAVGVLLGGGIAIGRATASGGDDNESSFEGRSEGRSPRQPGEGEESPRPRPASGVFLGVVTQEASGDQAGAEIVAVGPDSPAAGAGLQEGDVITAVDGSAVAGPAELAERIRSHDPGDQVTIAYSRGGNAAEAQVELADRLAENEPNS